MKRLNNLEGLRGYMSIWVFFTHAITLASLPFYKEHGIGKILVNGYHAVAVFILLSGFVVYFLLSKGESYKVFIARRALRLFPIYLFALLITASLLGFYSDTLSLIPWTNSKNISRLNQLEQVDSHFWVHLVSHIFLVHGVIPQRIIPTSYSIMGQAWSLTLEWQFYLFAPLLHNLIVRKVTKGKSVLVTSIILVIVIISRIKMPQPTFLPNMLYLFAIGYFTCRLYSAKSDNSKSTLMVFLIIICLTELMLGPLYISIIKTIPFFIWTVAIYSEINKIKFLDYLLSNKIALFFGKISYSFYCIHMIILMLTAYFLLAFSGITSQSTYAILLISLAFIATSSVSYLTYTYIEVPFMNFGKTLFAKTTQQSESMPIVKAFEG